MYFFSFLRGGGGGGWGGGATIYVSYEFSKHKTSIDLACIHWFIKAFPVCLRDNQHFHMDTDAHARIQKFLSEGV